MLQLDEKAVKTLLNHSFTDLPNPYRPCVSHASWCRCLVDTLRGRSHEISTTGLIDPNHHCGADRRHRAGIYSRVQSKACRQRADSNGSVTRAVFVTRHASVGFFKPHQIIVWIKTRITIQPRANLKQLCWRI